MDQLIGTKPASLPRVSINALECDKNYQLLGHNEADEPNILFLWRLCQALKNYDFNIRCCFNLSDAFNKHTIGEVLEFAKKDCRADQVTFRSLYASADNTEQRKWIDNHSFDNDKLEEWEEFVGEHEEIGNTAYGETCYDIDGMSVMISTDCMGKNPETGVKKYLILRQNCKLYSQWDSPSSLVF